MLPFNGTLKPSRTHPQKKEFHRRRRAAETQQGPLRKGGQAPTQQIGRCGGGRPLRWPSPGMHIRRAHCEERADWQVGRRITGTEQFFFDMTGQSQIVGPLVRGGWHRPEVHLYLKLSNSQHTDLVIQESARVSVRRGRRGRE